MEKVIKALRASEEMLRNFMGKHGIEYIAVKDGKVLVGTAHRNPIPESIELSEDISVPLTRVTIGSEQMGGGRERSEYRGGSNEHTLVDE